MSKIIKAINVMISNPDKISDVIIGIDDNGEATKEIFFLYSKKQKWSISRVADVGGKEDYNLFYYPGKEALEELAKMDIDTWQITAFVAFRTKELKTAEAFDSFRELYNLLDSKIYNMDEVLDEIIAGDRPF